MLSIFVQGLMLGYGACIPLGPINVLIANYALRSYKQALAIGLGAMSADISYLLLVIFGLLKLIKGTWLLEIISFLGGFFLLYIAYLTYKNRHRVMQKKVLDKENIMRVYLKGFWLTLLNPYTVGFWISVATLSSQSVNQPVLLLSGLIVAIFSWTTLMPLFVHKSKHLLTDAMINIFSIVSASILAGFGVMILFNAV